jgi:hypothetical protein
MCDRSYGKRKTEVFRRGKLVEVEKRTEPIEGGGTLIVIIEALPNCLDLEAWIVTQQLELTLGSEEGRMAFARRRLREVVEELTEEGKEREVVMRILRKEVPELRQ